MQGVNELQAAGVVLLLWTKSKYISSIWHVAGAGAGLRPAALSSNLVTSNTTICWF